MIASKVANGANNKIFRVLGPIIKKPGGIDLVLAGHNHLSERRKLVDGVLHITLGNGGDLDKHPVFPPDEDRVIGYNKRSCLGWIKCDENRLVLLIVNEDGQIIDKIQLEKISSLGIPTITGLPTRI